MANLQLSTEKQRKVPINRNNLFYSDESFEFDMMMGLDYISHDVNQTVVLYEVDLKKTNLDDTYKEAKSNQVMFKPPVEIHVIYEIDKSELRSYEKNKNLGTYIKGGKLSFGVYQYTLDEVGADIKNGDYIGVQVTPTNMQFYVVVDDGRNNYDNAHTMYGTRPFWRSIVCASVDKSEFDGDEQIR